MSAPFSDPGSFRSVADITDAETLDRVRAFKQALKAANKAKGSTDSQVPRDSRARSAAEATGRRQRCRRRRARRSHRPTCREALSAPETGTLARRRLYLCTADRPDLATFLESCIAGGVDVVQLRDKHLEARDLVERGRLAARSVCADHDVPFILNDRPDLALEIGADGVHVGQHDASPALARRILGPDAIVGLSTHAPEELESSRDEPVDYVSAGPVTPTPTKPGRPGRARSTSRSPWPRRDDRSS